MGVHSASKVGDRRGLETSDSSNQGWPIYEEDRTEALDVDFEPPATIEMVDEGIKLSTINETVDA